MSEYDRIYGAAAVASGFASHTAEESLAVPINSEIAAILAQDERRMLVVSMAHVTQETGENPTAISWANVKPYEDGFICYCRSEGDDDGDAPELLAIIRLARAYGYDYVMIDRDASAYDESVGLPIFDHD